MSEHGTSVEASSDLSTVGRTESPPNSAHAPGGGEQPSTGRWVIASASVSGLSSLSGAKLLQDAHRLRLVADGGVAVVADGAGTLGNSHLGANLVAETLSLALLELALERHWAAGVLPDFEEWMTVAGRLFAETRASLQEYASDKSVEFGSLGCTVIAVVFSRQGLLVAHIGDGRAAYRSRDGQWRSAMTPFRGGEVGATAFITSDVFDADGPMKPYFETRVIAEELTALALLTDGCERVAFSCYQKRADGETYWDPNTPHAPFFEPNCAALRSLARSGAASETIDSAWAHFLSNGSPDLPALREQADDKTMILGCLVDE